MKKFKLILFLVLTSLSVFSQIKSFSYLKYGIINQYTNNSVLPVEAKLMITKVATKLDNNFLILIYDPNIEKYPLYALKVFFKGYDELNEVYVYVGDATREGIAKGKCLINTSHKLDFYLENKGKENNKDWTWDGELSFTVFFKNIKFQNDFGSNEYIKDTSIKIFPIKNITQLEQKEEISKEKQREEEEKLDIEKIKAILSELDIETKVSQIKKEIEDHYITLIKESMTNVSASNIIRYYKNYTQNIFLKGEFMLYLDKKNRDAKLIKRNVNCSDANLSTFISDDKFEIYDKSLLRIKEECRNEYEIDEQTYYKLSNTDIFTDDYKVDKKILLKVALIGVSFKNKKFKYYTKESITYANEMVVPKEVEQWCTENITSNGLYFINYVMIDDELAICRILNLDKKAKDYLKMEGSVN